MNRAELLDEVQVILQIELDDPAAQITRSTVVDDIQDWDSVTHVRIIVAIESRFGIMFDLEEYTTFANVGEMIDCIARKLPKEGDGSGVTARA
jgi:acyl carrier protein